MSEEILFHDEASVEGVISGTSLPAEVKDELMGQLKKANGDNHKVKAVHERCLHLAGGATQAFSGKVPTHLDTK